MKKTLLLLACSLYGITAFAGLSIRFGTEASYPPFEFINQQNQLTGFDIDIAQGICKEIDAHCTFVNQSFDGLIPSLKFKRIDAAISAIDITPTREKQVLFTSPYYQNSSVFLTNKDSIMTINNFKGKRVGVQNGSTHQKYLQENYPDIITVAYDSYQNAILDLENGRLDGVFCDTAYAQTWLKKDPNLVEVGQPITDPAYFGSGLAIAVAQRNNALLTQLNTGLQKMHQDGSYAKIYAKWFQNAKTN